MMIERKSVKSCVRAARSAVWRRLRYRIGGDGFRRRFRIELEEQLRAAGLFEDVIPTTDWIRLDRADEVQALSDVTLQRRLG
jgi:hypothetical protein